MRHKRLINRRGTVIAVSGKEWADEDLSASEIEHEAWMMLRWQEQNEEAIHSLLPTRHVAEADRLIGSHGEVGGSLSKALRLIESQEWNGGRDGLMMSGSEGCGKTTSLVAIGMAHIRAGGRCIYITPTDMAKYMMSKDPCDSMHRTRLEETGLLLIDELHRMDALPDWLRSELIGVIDHRYRELKPMAAAGTLPPSEILDVVGIEVVKRFKHRIGSNDGSHRA